MSVLLTVNYKAKDGMRESFVGEIISSGILDKIRHEDGIIRYEYYYDAADSSNILLLEEWKSEEHQQKHLLAPHMTALKEIKDRYISETDVRKFAV